MATVTFRSHRARVERGLSAAVSRAMNRSAISARAVGARLIARDVGWRVGSIRQRLRIRRANPQDLEVRLSMRGRGIPLIHLRARGPVPSRGRGRLTYRFEGRRIVVPGAFIATSTKTGRVGVFRRTSVKRYPLEFLVGPSFPDVFSKQATVDAIIARYREAMIKTLRHEVEFEVRQT